MAEDDKVHGYVIVTEDGVRRAYIVDHEVDPLADRFVRRKIEVEQDLSRAENVFKQFVDHPQKAKLQNFLKGDPEMGGILVLLNEHFELHQKAVHLAKGSLDMCIRFESQRQRQKRERAEKAAAEVLAEIDP
jgi:hypothetical protein